MVLRQLKQVSGWMTRLCGGVVIWVVCLVLLVLLAMQVHLLTFQNLALPQALRDEIEQRLFAQGLRLKMGTSRMDFAGHVILQDVRLGPVSLDDPVITASSIYARIDLWSLLIGRVDLDEIKISGLDLHLPAIRSLSGVDDIMVQGGDLLVKPNGREIVVSHLSGYIRGVPIHVAGSFLLPRGRSTAWAGTSGTVLTTITAAWLKLAREVQRVDGVQAAFDTPRLHVQLTDADVGGAQATIQFRAAGVDLGKLPGGASGYIKGVRADTTLPLTNAWLKSLDIAGAVEALQLPREITAEGLVFRLRGTAGGVYGVDPRSLDLQLASLRWRAIEVGPLAATVTQPESGYFVADLSSKLAGAPWRLQGTVLPHTGFAQVMLDGFIEDATLAFVGSQIGRDLNHLLDPAQPAPLHAVASFGPDYKLTAASGRLHSGFVQVGGVPIDEAGTEFNYDGTRVLCDNLVLRLGDSLAHGSYEMDTRTMDFRFLLEGGLRPMGISPWFNQWWSNFWRPFTFNEKLPVASVDIRGRWGDLTATQVFVQADCADIGIESAAFDRVRTRLFLRPHWFDIRSFEVNRFEQSAQGWLVRSLEMENSNWTSMEFGVTSSLPLETIEQLFKADSAELLAPYKFSKPPQMKLGGRVDSVFSSVGKHERIDIELSSADAMTYHDLPLSDLAFTAQVRDNRIELPGFTAVFAKGGLKGQAKVEGDGAARRLFFDASLKGANVGALSQAVEIVVPKSATAPVLNKSEKAVRARQQLLDNGQVDISLAAEGLYTNFFSFNGKGRATLREAELGQLNLFGPLSEALSGSFINFGSFSLNRIETGFELMGDRVRFPDMRVTGPSALLEAKGDYQLRDGSLSFTTKVYPFDENSSVVGHAVGFVLTPLSRVLEVKLRGTMSEPSWIFSYGPSRLLNALIGAGKNDGEADLAPPASIAP